MKNVLIILGILSSILILPNKAYSLLIDTFSVSTEYAVPFGEPNSGTYGQTFDVGSETYLDFIKVYINEQVFGSSNANNPTKFSLFVYDWNIDRIIGPALYESPMQTIAMGEGLKEISFNIGANLTSGDYIFFGSASPFFDGLSDSARWAGVPDGGSYNGGHFYHFNNGNNFSLLSSNAWTSVPSFDLAFKLNLIDPPQEEPANPIPEPATAFLLGSGLIYLTNRFKNLKKDF